MRYPDTAHWRDSARTPKLFMIDAYSAIPLFIFLLHIRWWTFITACCITAFFVLINRFGFTVPVFFRWLRAFMAGNERSARSWRVRKRK